MTLTTPKNLLLDELTRTHIPLYNTRVTEYLYQIRSGRAKQSIHPLQMAIYRACIVESVSEAHAFRIGCTAKGFDGIKKPL